MLVTESWETQLSWLRVSFDLNEWLEVRLERRKVAEVTKLQNMCRHYGPPIVLPEEDMGVVCRACAYRAASMIELEQRGQHFWRSLSRKDRSSWSKRFARQCDKVHRLGYIIGE